MDSKPIKEEPFEEFLFTESTNDLNLIANGEFAESYCCELCPETIYQLKVLANHLNTNHPATGLGLNYIMCGCEDGLQIQAILIRHLMARLLVKTETEIFLKTDGSELIDIPTRSSDPLPKANEILEPDLTLLNPDLVETYEVNFVKRKLHRNIDPIPSKRQKLLDEIVPTRIKCDLCPKLFKYKQGVQKHWNLEHSLDNQFPCTKPNCHSRCKTLKNLHAHLRTHDPPRKEGLGELQCAKCLKSFQSQKQLSLHLYTHREKFFICDKCGSKFNNREQVKNHVLRHVGLFNKKTSHQKIICDECSMLVFSYKMKRHKLIHHSYEKPFKCDFPGCSAAFSDSRILSDHKNIHLKLKPYRCEYCPEAFRSGANLRLHRLRHIDPDRFRCEECQTSFVTKQALTKHNRRHTEDPDVRPFACNYEGCNSTFKQKEHVRIHIKRTHEKSDDVFSCEFCSKCYNRKDALGKHMRKVHNVAKRKTRVFPIEQSTS